MISFLEEFPSVEVEWLDAQDIKGETIQDLTTSETTNNLVRRVTFGKKVREDSFGVVLVTDIDEDGFCEAVAIPKSMLVRIYNND